MLFSLPRYVWRSPRAPTQTCCQRRPSRNLDLTTRPENTRHDQRRDRGRILTTRSKHQGEESPVKKRHPCVERNIAPPASLCLALAVQALSRKASKTISGMHSLLLRQMHALLSEPAGSTRARARPRGRADPKNEKNEDKDRKCRRQKIETTTCNEIQTQNEYERRTGTSRRGPRIGSETSISTECNAKSHYSTNSDSQTKRGTRIKG